MAVLVAVDASLTSFQILPWFNGLRWLRIHVITLGAMTEVLFGLLPVAVAIRMGQPRPEFHWGTWLTLNLGLLTLLIGIPIVNQALSLSGGTLILFATILLILQLQSMRSMDRHKSGEVKHESSGRKFYVMGLSYFLVGIIIGTGLWLGWSDWLRIQNPIIFGVAGFPDAGIEQKV